MQLPSLQHLAAEMARVARRFPLTLLCSFVLGGVGTYLIQRDTSTSPQEGELQWLFPLLTAAGLGLPLMLALAVTAERYGWRPAVKAAAQLGALALLGLWYALAPAEPNLIWALRLMLLLLAAHLAVAAGPYLAELRGTADTPGFWRYNQTLFLRILTAALYSGVLFAGCALALLAVDNLFGVKLDGRWYGYLFVGLATVFNTWFFLAGVPTSFAALEQPASYPKGLKVFTQFVLLPLVVLYFAILYAYLGRILLTWTLPQGWVSVLVLALAVAGIFALLLIHPIREVAENAWISTFARWFYRALFPLLGLLAVAIGTRIAEYGITEERYFVLLLAGWLLGMAAYFLWRRGQGIIWIPASLGLLALLAAGGPWGAFAVAERSQLGQLREISQQFNLLQNGHLDSAAQRQPNLPFKAQQRLSSVFEFFAARDALSTLQPLFAASLTPPDSVRNLSRQQQSWQGTDWKERPFTLTGYDRITRYATEKDVRESAQRVNFGTERSNVTSEVYALGNGRYWVNDINVHEYDGGIAAAKVVAWIPLADSSGFRLRALRYGRQLLLEQRQGMGSWQPRLSVSPGALADSLAAVHGRNLADYRVNLTVKDLTLRAASSTLILQLYLTDLTREQQGDTVRYNYQARALLEVR
ncbi:DUF4153 domain-containing protein [Hymenobacter lapidiphilus]|uniref:DUF4153 domain-containing protein n=1 Tax=Hymenobacter lapidiphilus TaxID=2608003 RepID=A0A7Y7PQE7_9BACT|nr:DUF4153 domain-containing protein [Hymenobacter lapidiphilus]NVO32156.1 DUF4153 domain-containing protein [Hymenobacter lapidiphilus]